MRPFTRHTWIAGAGGILFAFGLVSPAWLAAQTGPPRPGVPAPETILALIRTHILALDHAFRTNNFSVLRALSGLSLRKQFTDQTLAAAFANVRAEKPDLVAAAIATPQVREAPAILADGKLRLAGDFPGLPRSLGFEMLFEVDAGEWKLAGMNIAVGSAPPAATPAAPAAKSTPKSK